MKKRRVISIILLLILLISFVFNYDSTAKYIQSFPEVSQNITSARWEVDSSIEYNGEVIGSQAIEEFMPGDSEKILITLKNNNNYETKFYIEVETKGVTENNNLFLNQNIKLDIRTLEQIDGTGLSSNGWTSIQGQQGAFVYYYEIILLPHSDLSLEMNIKWESNENDIQYAEKGGYFNYIIKAEQVIKSENY